MVINSTISTPGARYMVGDISDFYLGTSMTRYEYMKMPIALIPQEIIDEYNLMPLVYKDHIYMEIQRGMYGLPQAGLLANDLLTERLAAKGYYQVGTPQDYGVTNGVPSCSLSLWMILV
jgi:hypothetical protein